RLTVSDGMYTATDDRTVTVNPASSQIAFYVDPTYQGAASDGSAQTPWTSIAENNGIFNQQWDAINAALAKSPVIIYFSARQAGSDISEEANFPLRVARTDKSTNRLTLDGMSMYNIDDKSPYWLDYAGAQKFRINMNNGYACCFSIGWYEGPNANEADGKEDY